MCLIKGHLRDKLPKICQMCEYPATASTVSLSEHKERLRDMFDSKGGKI